MDEQSLQGKVINGVADLCKKHNKPLSLFVGENELSEKQVKKLNAKHIFSIFENAKNVDDAILNGAFYLEKIAGNFQQKIKNH